MNAQRIAGLVVGCCLLPAAMWAQQANGTIAGVVKDGSGAVMPGVTVEAASPALIEKVRTVVTDGQGQFKIVDLRPGAYVVTFTLAGFSTLKREGIDLAAGFTATVNGELKVGALEETVTVTGAAPVVDTQSVQQQTTVQRSTLDAIPTTRRLAQLNTIIPGATSDSTTFHDVGGVGSDRGQFAIHGQRSNDMTYNFAGLDSKIANGGNFIYNIHTIQEVVVETAAGSAEATTGGVQLNIVPRDGGNIFSGTVSTEHTGPALQSDNLTDALRARGLTAAPSVRKLYDVGGGFGGPIKRDKLWFFAAERWLARSQYQAGNYFNKRQGTLFYEPDLSRPAYTDDYYRDHSVRLTWQAAAKHKFVIAHDQHQSCQCSFNLLESTNPRAAPEAVGEHHYDPLFLSLVTWTYPATNRLLIEGAAAANRYFRNSKREPGVGENDIAVTDLGKNLIYGSRATALTTAGSYGTFQDWRDHQRISMSYITGSHSFKTGFDFGQFTTGRPDYSNPNQINQARSYTFRNEVPVSVSIWATPFGTLDHAREVSLYAQDQWTVRRATLNVGLRYSDYKAWVPAYHLAAGPWVPARDFPAVDNAPHWKDLNPRLGIAYDLFGEGKTALKATLGRYSQRNVGVATNNPAVNQAATTTRNWNDSTFGAGDPRTGNFVPDCDLRNSAVNGECAAWGDLSFGQIRAGNTRYADDALQGLNREPYNWQGSVSLQHQLRTGMALNVGYFRTWYGGFLATDNQFVTPANYDPYCITVAADSRLPGSGQPLCGLYDVTPAKQGQIDNLVTQASHYGDQTEVFTGLDVGLSTRFGRGGQIQGGFSTGRTMTDNCFVVDSPQQAREGFCHVSRPWAAATQVKFSVVYSLPWDLQSGAVYQNIPGFPMAATYVATNAEIRPSLGRNLAACPSQTAATCTSTVTLGDATTGGLIPLNSYFEDRIQQLDLRASRIFVLGRARRLRANFDVYNTFNASTILNEQTRYSATNNTWLNAVQIMGGRVFKFSAQLEF
jgi:hypothetical protein